MIPNVAGEIKSVTEFNSFARTMADITSLAVRATVEMVKVMPDVGPGGGSKIIGEHAEMEKVYTDAILEFKSRWG